MSHFIKIDFYKVEMPADFPLSFQRLVMNDAATTDDETRNEEIGAYPVRLQSAKGNIDGFLEGEMLKIQMFDLPPKANLKGKVGSLGLKTDEGIGGETAFLYDYRTRVLVLQRNRSVVTARMLSEYFSNKGSLAHPILLHPVIESEAINRLVRMKEMKKVKIRIAGITNPRFFQTQGHGLSEMIGVANHFFAPSATFELSMGHQEGSLSVQRIVSLARHVFNWDSADSGEVSKIEVNGILDDDSRDAFDVLAYRMVENAEVESSDHRRSSYKIRRPTILQAWNRRKDELSSMFEEES